MRDYLICIDSDGCAIDSMEIKHRRCFGPCIIDEWRLDAWREPLLERWNEINLYSLTRGINRFLGLELLLTEVDKSLTPIDGLAEYRRWCAHTPSFSNDMVEQEIEAGGHPIFTKVLSWSRAVNWEITRISGEIRPFDGVERALKQLHGKADIAIVSSANPQAVREEWTRFGFMEDVDYVMAQDAGTKADCIARMIARGYAKERILVLGDAPGDQRSAAENGVWYYPILAGQEKQSWDRLTDEISHRLFAGKYDTILQEELTKAFYENLGGNCP